LHPLEIWRIKETKAPKTGIRRPTGAAKSQPEFRMKKMVLLSLFALLAVSGCARHYTVTLNNGTQISSKGKPKRQGAAYVFTDAAGNQRRVSAGSVTEVAPSSMVKGNSDKFQFNPSK
jgi:hypothetical protein